MKIRKTVSIDTEVMMDVSAGDIRVILGESEDPVFNFLAALNDFATVIKGCPDEVMQKLNVPQRKAISEFFTDQAKRFSV